MMFRESVGITRQKYGELVQVLKKSRQTLQGWYMKSLALSKNLLTLDVRELV